MNMDLYNQLIDQFSGSVYVALVGGMILGLMFRLKS